MIASDDALLSVRGLRTWFPITRGLFKKTVGHIKAVDGVSFDILPGQTLALVGESGCGKTTVGRSILRLIEPSAGQVLYRGRNLLDLSQTELGPYRRKIQMVFQDPMTSLDPRMRVRSILEEGLLAFGIGETPSERHERAAEALRRVKLSPDHLERFPHEFSGGQRQRIGIARALAVEPELVVCDEAVSALDVSIRAQVMNLLLELQEELGVAYLFITHDLSVVRHLAHEVAVMYLGQIVETASVEDIFARPLHPYTQLLLGAELSIDPDDPRIPASAQGDVPSPARPPAGCRFHTRCPKAFEPCGSVEPRLAPSRVGAGDRSHQDMGKEDRLVSCHLYVEEVNASPTAPEQPFRE